MLVGPPASGKSTLARAVAQRLPAMLLHSDAVRKELYASPRYTAAEHRHVFAEVHRRAWRALEAGDGVVLDATNLEERHRRVFYRLAAASRSQLLVARLVVSEGEALRRLGQRATAPDPGEMSDADRSVYHLLAPRLEPIGRSHWLLNGTARPALLANLVVQQLARTRGPGPTNRARPARPRLPHNAHGGKRNVEARR